jgi:hypothetical protein
LLGIEHGDDLVEEGFLSRAVHAASRQSFVLRSESCIGQEEGLRDSNSVQGAVARTLTAMPSLSIPTYQS